MEALVSLAASRGYTLRRSRRKVPTLRRRRERWEVVELGAAFTDDSSARAWLDRQPVRVHQLEMWGRAA
jgi:hypothetical protein